MQSQESNPGHILSYPDHPVTHHPLSTGSITRAGQGKGGSLGGPMVSMQKFIVAIAAVTYALE